MDSKVYRKVVKDLFVFVKLCVVAPHLLYESVKTDLVTCSVRSAYRDVSPIGRAVKEVRYDVDRVGAYSGLGVA